MSALETADDLLQMPDHKLYELIEGRSVKWGPEGLLHGATSAAILGTLFRHVYENDLGVLLGAGCGFFLQHDPDTVRAADGAFIAQGRLPSDADPDGFVETPPDLVVEVVGFNDMAEHLQAKIGQWIKHGVKLVWVAYPEQRSLMVYRSLSEVQVLPEGDTLTGDPVLPGFSCSVNEIF